MQMKHQEIDVSIIIPIYNGELWLEKCLESVLLQDFNGSMELSVFDDASSDNSKELLKSWSVKLKEQGIKVLFSSGVGEPRGVGYAKNQAIAQSSGQYLCFLDAIVGCQYHRDPIDSTPRYTNWANKLTPSQLYLQIYTAFGPTLIMPTWFCHRNLFKKIGDFDETGKGTPEDLLFFFKHLRLGGKLVRVDEDLLLYRFHPSATTFSITEDSLWQVRLKELEQNILVDWEKFTIWNAGKQGKKFYRSLSTENKTKVQAFCDVDRKKILKGVYIYEECMSNPRPRIPIIHFSKGIPPFVLCIKLDMTSGVFEENLSSLNLIEGKDYVHFS